MEKDTIVLHFKRINIVLLSIVSVFVIIDLINPKPPQASFIREHHSQNVVRFVIGTVLLCSFWFIWYSNLFLYPIKDMETILAGSYFIFVISLMMIISALDVNRYLKIGTVIYFLPFVLPCLIATLAYYMNYKSP